MRAIGAWVGLALTACTSSATMIVELRSELRPGYELNRVETELFAPDALPGRDAPLRVAPSRVLGPSDDGLVGVRVAELEGLDVGSYLVRVRLFDDTGDHQGSGIVLVALRVSRVVTVIVNRDCRDVVCPGDGPPTAIACLDGRCVEPTCPEDPTACPPPECAVDADCGPGGGPSCVRGACLGRFCVEYPDDALCDTGRCDRGGGCLGDVTDAGVDAGLDGGVDAGMDAGFDAGFDAGPPCVPLRGTMANISFSMLGPGSPTWPAVNSSCLETGQTPYYLDYTFCNRETAPYGFYLEITPHPSLPNMPSPTMWGYRGETTGGACDFRVSGVGSVTPYQLLNPGEYYTVRIGGSATGSTGAVAARLEP